MAITKISNLPSILNSTNIVTNNIGRTGSPIEMVRGDLFETSLLANSIDPRFSHYSVSLRLDDLIHNVAGKIFESADTPSAALSKISPFAYNSRYAATYKNGDRLFFIKKDSTNASDPGQFSVIRAVNLGANESAPAPVYSLDDLGNPNGNVGYDPAVEGIFWVFDTDFFNPNPIPLLFTTFSPFKFYNSGWIESTPEFIPHSGKTYLKVYEILSGVVNTTGTEIDLSGILPVYDITPATKITESYPINLGATVTDNISSNKFNDGLSADLRLQSGETISVSATERSLIEYTQYGYDETLIDYAETDKLYYGSSPWGPFCKSNPWVVIPEISSNIPAADGNLNTALGPIAVFNSISSLITTPIAARQPRLIISGLPTGNHQLKIRGLDPDIRINRLAGNTNAVKSYRIEGHAEEFTATVQTYDAQDTELSSATITITPGVETVVDVKDAAKAIIKVVEFTDSTLNTAQYSQSLPVFAIGSINITETPKLITLQNAKAYHAEGVHHQVIVVDARNETLQNSASLQQVQAELTDLSHRYGHPDRPILPFFTLVETSANNRFILPYFPSVEALTLANKGVITETLPNIRAAFPAGHISPYSQFNTRGAVSLEYQNKNSQSNGPEPGEWKLTRSNEPAEIFNAGASSKAYKDGATVQTTGINGFLYFYAGNMFAKDENPEVTLSYIQTEIDRREYELTSDTLEITTYSQDTDFDASDLPNMVPSGDHTEPFGITKIDLKIDEGSVLRFDDNKNLQLKIGTGLIVDDPHGSPKVSYNQSVSSDGLIEVGQAITTDGIAVEASTLSAMGVYPADIDHQYSYDATISLPWNISYLNEEGIESVSALTVVFNATGTTLDVLSGEVDGLKTRIILNGSITPENFANAGITLSNIKLTTKVGGAQVDSSEFSSEDMINNILTVKAVVEFDNTNTPENGTIKISSVNICRTSRNAYGAQLLIYDTTNKIWIDSYTQWKIVINSLYRLYNTDYQFANNIIKTVTTLKNDVDTLKELVTEANTVLYNALYGSLTDSLSKSLFG